MPTFPHNIALIFSSSPPRKLFWAEDIYEINCENLYRKSPKPPRFRTFLRRYLNRFAMFLAGMGFEPHDLRVMSPTSYQAALPRDIKFPENGVPVTGLEPVRDRSHGILSPGRLPVPPHRHLGTPLSRVLIYYNRCFFLCQYFF